MLASRWSGLERLCLDGREVSRQRSFGFASHHRFELPVEGDAELWLRVDGLRGRLRYTLRVAGQLVREDVVGIPLPALAGVQGAAVVKPGFDLVDSTGFWPRLRGVLRRPWVVKTLLTIASLLAGAWLMDVPLAVALLGLMVVHEQGHLWAIRRCGLRSGGMYLIPFVGGLAIGEQPAAPGQAAFIALMGPLAVLLVSLVLCGAYLLDGSRLLGLTASLGLIITLIDLLPLYPLDGGRLVVATFLPGQMPVVLRSLMLVAVLGCLAALWLGSFLLGFIALLGAFQLASAWRSPPDPHEPRLDAKGRTQVLCAYLGTVTLLLGLLVVMTDLGVPGTAWLR